MNMWKSIYQYMRKKQLVCFSAWIIVFLCGHATIIFAQSINPYRIPLLPSGGAKWDFIFDTHLAHHPEKNRFYTVASATDGKRLLHFDSITGAVIASMTTTAQPDWSPIDIEVWKNGNEVLVAWGKIEQSERIRGIGLELGRADVNTGYTKGASESVRFISFDIDQVRDIAWGITAPTNETQYAITSMNLKNGSVNNFPINLAINENIIRDVILDASSSRLFTLLQPAKPGNPNLVEHYGIILSHQLPSGQEMGRLVIPPLGNYRPGGIALVQQRGLIYILPFDGGSLHQIDAQTMTITHSWKEKEIAPYYQALGALDVQDYTGRLFLASDAENMSASRTLLFDPVDSRVVRAWTSGADPTAVIYDERLDRVYTASSRASMATVLEASNEKEVSTIPISLNPATMIYDNVEDRLFLFTEAYQLLDISLKNSVLSDSVQLDNYSQLIGAVLDTIRERLISGVSPITPPIIIDTNTLARIGSLEKAGPTLVIAPEDGLIFQTGGTFSSSVAPLYISDATTGALKREIPASSLYAQVNKLAVDEARDTLYGIRSFPSRLWSYNWVSDATEQVNIDAGSPSALAVDEQSGRIVVVTNNNIISVFDTINDPTPFVQQIINQSVISDVFIEPVDGLVIATGFDFTAMKLFVGWMGLDGAPSYQQIALGLQTSGDARFTMDARRQSLWLATELPSALHRIPWPWLNSAPKPEMNKLININVKAMPGYNHILWDSIPGPSTPVAMQIYRQEGLLAEFHPLLPAVLPATATDYIDPDVVPGQRYYYRMEWYDASGISTSSEIVWVIANDIGSQDIRLRPLNWLARIPAGSSAEMTLLFQGEYQSSHVVSIHIGETNWIDRSKIAINAMPQQITVPGAVQLVIHAATDAPLGLVPIPVSITNGISQGTLWLYADIFQPLNVDSNKAILYPYDSSSVGIHTDSRLRENSENILVLKGRINLQPGENRGSGVIARYQIDNATINVQRGLLASNGQYAFSVRLPALTPDTIVRAQVTWLGTNTLPGGVSPVIQLPVGGYSAQAKAKPGEIVEDPEPAFFIRGQTPADASSDDINNIVNHATRTLLSEFKDDQTVYSTTSEVDIRLKSIQKAKTALFYAIGDTSGDSVQLLNGTALTAIQLRKWIDDLSPEVNPIIIIEGKKSERFMAALEGSRATIIVSSKATDNVNVTDASGSFSYQLFTLCKNNFSLLEAFRGAYNLMSMFRQQHPVGEIRESVAMKKIAGRYVPSALPDFIPPRFMTFPQSRRHFSRIPYEIAMKVQDDKSDTDNTRVEIQVIENDGALSARFFLNPPGSPDGFYTGRIESPPWPSFTLVAVASDSSGNQSDPLSIHISTRADWQDMDLKQDGNIDAVDLFLWSSNREMQYEGWIFDAVDVWHKNR